MGFVCDVIETIERTRCVSQEVNEVGGSGAGFVCFDPLTQAFLCILA